MCLITKESPADKDQWYIVHPTPKDCILLSCDVFIVLEFFPFLIKNRSGTLHRGIFTIESSTLETEGIFTQIVTRYLHRLSKDKRLLNFITAVENKTSDAPIEETTYMSRLITANAKGNASRRRLSAVKHSDAPPCITALYAETKPWNNEMRFQLSMVLKSVSSTWGTPVHQLASTFIDYMRLSGMTERRIKHLTVHLNRHTKEDSRLCITRKHKNVATKREIYCYYGGGEAGVQTCISRRSFASKSCTPDNASISTIWAYSSPKETTSQPPSQLQLQTISE